MSVVYAPRVAVHDERRGVRKTVRNRLFVLHTSEGSEGETSAEALGSFMTRPATRDATGRITNLASYQYVTDTDRIIPAVPEDEVAYSATGANHDGIHICFPGRINQGRAGWLDPTSYAYLSRAAELMIERSGPTGIPLRRLSDAQIKAGWSGYCDHWAISRVYGRSTHTDVGEFFPWDVFDSLLHPATTVDPVKRLVVHVPTDPARGGALVQIEMIGFDTPEQRTATARLFKARDRALTPGQWDFLVSLVTD